MDDTRPLPPDDDRPVPMAWSERMAWVYGGTVAVTSGGYFALVTSRMRTEPIHAISWVRPMLGAVALSVVGTIVIGIIAAIVASILSAIARPGTGRPGDRSGPVGRNIEAELSSDVRDQEIGRTGQRASAGVLGAGCAAGLILAMIDADAFWIGNALFLAGTIAAFVETATKIRLYRHGF